MKRRALGAAFLLLLSTSIVFYGDEGTRDSRSPDRGLQGYAGPGWSVLFGPDGTGEMASLGPVMFRISERTLLGPIVVYEESASEGPGTFLGGMKVESYLPRLSRGFYATSMGFSVLAGAESINGSARFAAQLNGELNANFLIFPAFCLAVGPQVSLRLGLQGGAWKPAFLPGFAFSLKEGSSYSGRPLFLLKEDGCRFGGYWQGLWTFVNGRAVFIDGGGTRFELPMGLAFGITGGVLRQRIEQAGSDLAVMLSGVTGEWNWHAARWLTVTPRLATGLAMYGWIAPDGTIDGAPHFMLRPELCAYIGVLPFMEIGGGIGYHIVGGDAQTSIPLGSLSAVCFSVQVRVAHR